MAEAKKTEELPRDIYSIIPRIREEVGTIAKDQKANGANYSYRGTDAIINALAPILNKYGVFTTVEDHDFQHRERQSGNKVVTVVTLAKRVTFYAPDGSHVSSTTYGENSDYSDKATGGASTYAYRYALTQTFVLPTDEKAPEAKEPIQRTVPTQAPVAAPVNDQAQALKAVRAAIRDAAKAANPDNPTYYTGLGDEKFGADSDWKNNPKKLEAVLKAIQAGETV